MSHARVHPYPKASAYARLTPYEMHVTWAKFRIADKQLRAAGLRNNECRKVADTLERLLARQGRPPRP